MASEKDISSTEKLLNVIRQDPQKNGGGSSLPSGGATGPSPAFRPGMGLSSLKSREVVGVEIQENYLNVVRMVRSGSDWKAIQAFSASIPENVSPNTREFEGFLRSQLQSIEGIKKARIWAILPDSKGEIWHAKVPPVKKDLANAVYWTAKKERNFDDSTTVFDYRVQGEITDNGAKKLSVLVYTAPIQEINFLKKVFAGSGFDLAGITLAPFALRNPFVAGWNRSSGEAHAVLYIGEHTSHIDIHDKDSSLVLSRAIKTGLNSMMETLVHEASGMPEIEVVEDSSVQPAPEASAIDRKKALELITWIESRDNDNTEEHLDTSYSQNKILEVISPALERLARQVERTIDHSVNVLGNPSPARIYLCGRLVSSESVVSFFHDQLGLEALILDTLNPSFPQVSPVISSMNRVQRMKLVPASGAAMSSNDYTPNFLYTAMDRDRQKIFRRNAGIAASILILALVITGGYWLQSKQDLNSTRMEVAGLKNELNNYNPRVSHEMVTLLSGRFQEHSSVLRDYSRKFVPAAVMSELTAITPDNVQLLNVRMDMGAAGGSGAGVQNSMMVVDGFIKGDDALFETYLSSYLFRIRSSPLFRDTVIHKSSAENFGSEGQVLRFIININLRQV